MTKNFPALYSASEIQRRVAELGAEVTNDFGSEGVVVVCVLKGAAIFSADLVRAIRCPVELDFIRANSYVGTQSSGTVQITSDITTDVAGKQVLVVEDIIDTGRTSDVILRHLSQKKPKRLELAALLDKPAAHEVPVNLRYKGFQIANEFVIGYGLDLDGKYRELPYIAQLNTQS